MKIKRKIWAGIGVLMCVGVFWGMRSAASWRGEPIWDEPEKVVGQSFYADGEISFAWSKKWLVVTPSNGEGQAVLVDWKKRKLGGYFEHKVLCFAPDERSAVVWSDNEQGLQLREVPSNRVLRQFVAPFQHQWVESARFTSDGQRFVAAGLHGYAVYDYRIAAPTVSRKLPFNETEMFYDSTLSSQANKLVHIEGHVLRVFDVVSGKPVLQIKLPFCAWEESGFIGSGDSYFFRTDNVFQIIDLATGKIRSLTVGKSEDCQIVNDEIWGRNEDLLIVYNLKTGRMLRRRNIPKNLSWVADTEGNHAFSLDSTSHLWRWPMR